VAPTNPQAQVSTSGSGVGAKFTLTWAAAAAANTVKLTARWQGINGNDIKISLNYYNKIGGEQLPPGLGIVLPPGAQSVTNAVKVAGGTGYLVGDLIYLGATTGVIVSVTSVLAGAVTGVEVSSGGTLPGGAATPTNPVSQTSTTGVGSGATFNLTWALTRPVGFLAGGTGTPRMDTAIANLGENQYDYVALPYTDSDTLQAWEYEYGFSDNGRWGWRRQLYGVLYSAKRDTYANLIDWGMSRNNGTTTVIGVEVDSPSPIYEWSAAYAGIAQRALINDPARPLQTLGLQLIKSAHKDQAWNIVELQVLASYGVATCKISSDHVTPMISRETTTYQLNLYGFSDDAYELVTTMSTLARLIRNQRQAITSKYPRHKLANDGTKFGPGQAIVTPGIIKAELVAEYQQDMWNGLVEDIRDFKANLLVERDPNDPNRVNVLYPPDLINQLRVFAVLAQFRLQYDRGIDQAIVSDATTGTITVIIPGKQIANQ
jgi:phage tail sheath gpL-like